MLSVCPAQTSVAPPGPSKLSKSTTAAEASAEADEDENEEDEEEDDEIELDEENEPNGSKAMTPRQKEKAAQRSAVAANKVGEHAGVSKGKRSDATCSCTTTGKATDDQEQSHGPEGRRQREEGEPRTLALAHSPRQRLHLYAAAVG